jgi:serine/threonine protein kinase
VLDCLIFQRVLMQYANRARSRSPSSEPQQKLPAVDADGHVDPNVHQIDRYENLQLIGKGTFGCVFKGWDPKHQREVALKVVRRTPKYFQDAKIEALTITRLQTELCSQDFCVIIYRYLEWNEHFCIAFEKLHSTLHSYIYDKKRRGIGCKRNVIQHVIFRLLRCVSYLHSVRIAHVDIKPENIMFTEDPRTTGNYQVKLIDFGAATWLTTHHSSLIQTRFYRAPEVIIESKWDEKADLWSVGCILLEMYFGRLVFDTHDSLEHLHLIEKFCGRIPQSLLQRSPDSCDLVERAIERCTMTPDESLRRIAELTKKRQYLLGFQSLKLVTSGLFFHFIFFLSHFCRAGHIKETPTMSELQLHSSSRETCSISPLLT